jgi:hypothetical protein
VKSFSITWAWKKQLLRIPLSDFLSRRMALGTLAVLKNDFGEFDKAMIQGV